MNGESHLDEARMGTPSIYDAPFDIPHFPCTAPSVQFIQTTSSRAAAVLGVLSECDRSFDTILLHFSCRFLCQGVRIPEGDVKFMGCCFRMQFIQQRRHSLTLLFRMPQDRRASANITVLLLYLGGPPPRDPRREEGLERQGNEVAVREEIPKERSGILDLGGR